MRPDARRTGAEETKEGGCAMAHALEGDGELIDVDGTPSSAGSWVKAAGIELASGASRCELMMSDACQVGGIDEQLPLGDAYGEDVRHVVVGDRVSIALPVDEAVD